MTSTQPLVSRFTVQDADERLRFGYGQPEFLWIKGVDPEIHLLALTRLVYAPEGAKVEIVPNLDDSLDPDLTLETDPIEGGDDTSS